MTEQLLNDFLTELRSIVEKESSKYPSRYDYPEILTASHIAEIMHISKRSAYEIMELKGFPLIRIGKSKRVTRDAFFKWLEQQEQKAS